MPIGLLDARDCFAALDAVRAYIQPILSTPVFGFMGGKSQIQAASRQGQPLRTSDICAWLSAHGATEVSRALILDDVLLFDSIWLQREYRRQRDWLAKVNR